MKTSSWLTSKPNNVPSQVITVVPNASTPTTCKTSVDPLYSTSTSQSTADIGTSQKPIKITIPSSPLAVQTKRTVIIVMGGKSSTIIQMSTKQDFVETTIVKGNTSTAVITTVRRTREWSLNGLGTNWRVFKGRWRVVIKGRWRIIMKGHLATTVNSS